MKRRFRHTLDLILVLTQKDLSVRYRKNFLGYLWSIANPLTHAFVFYVVFKVIMKFDSERYALFVTTGVFPWQWFMNSVTASATVFVSYATIVKKINFPRHVVPLSVVLQDAIHFALAIPVIVVLLAVFRIGPSVEWLWGVPLLLTTQMMIAYGLALFVSSVTLFFRDLERLNTVILTILFYFTPVIYSQEHVPEPYRALVLVNPFAAQIIGWRSLFIDGRMDWGAAAVAFAYGAAILLLGAAVFRRLRHKFAEVL